MKKIFKATPHKDCRLLPSAARHRVALLGQPRKHPVCTGSLANFSSDCPKSTNEAGAYEEILGKNDGKFASRRAAKCEARSLCGVALITVLFALSVILANTVGYADKERGDLTVLGDSIASGYGLSDYISGNDYSAYESFGNLLGAEYERYENFAVDGRKSGELLAVLSEPENAVRDSVSEADEVIISIGGNDFLKPMITAVKVAAISDAGLLKAILEGEFKPEMLSEYSNRVLRAALSAAENVDVENTVKNIGAITEKISEINPGARIVLLTIYNPFGGNVLMSAASQAAEEKLGQLNAGIKALQSENIRIADVYEAFKGHETEYTNINRLDIHPSAEGHYEIYRLLSDG